MEIDEVYDSAGGMILVTDPVKDITLDFFLAEHIDEDGTQQFLSNLCGGGMSIRGASTDGSPLYADGKLSKVWPGVVHQQCVFHLLHEANKDILRAVAAVRRRIRKLRPRRRGRPRKQGRPRKERFDKRQFVSKHRFLFVRRPDHLSPENRQHLARAACISPELAVIRRFTDQLHELLSPQQTPASARQLRDQMMKTQDYHAHPRLVRILRRLEGKKLEPFIAYLSSPGLERTTNHVERKNRRFRLLQKTRYKRRKLPTIAGAMKLELMYQKSRWEQAHPRGQPVESLPVVRQAQTPEAERTQNVPSPIAA